jgi:hypothetical protein
MTTETAVRLERLLARSIEIEPVPRIPVATATVTWLTYQLREALGLTVCVRVVEPGGLPRFEMKVRRFFVEGDEV